MVNVSKMRLYFGLFLCLGHIGGLQRNVHRPVVAPDDAYLAETFDEGALDRKWVLSKAVKDEKQKHTYDGQWTLEESVESKVFGNKGLVLKSPGRHHAISTNLLKVYHFIDRPLIIQYEVLFQKGIDCGGAYIKLLSHSDDLRLSQFSDATPYTIMFGPDKCGKSYRVHFIFSHRNPVTGKFEEKHAQQPELDLSDYFTDKQPHLYTLYLFPDNTFEISVDLTIINKGSLLEYMEEPSEPIRSDGKSPHPASRNPKTRVTSNDKAIRGQYSITLRPIAAVGFELLSMTGDVMFDNILFCDDMKVTRQWTEATWGQRKARFGPPDQDYYYKKTDDPQADGAEDKEEHDGVISARAEGEQRAVKRNRKNPEATS
ncbi:hypothetical protein DNTS_031569 [Danionella cerebrum]|uniref:Calnexin n=1 Tax=Danionella cerebrum TaxID=2873325 RepID=A0A553QJD6_9TELE|nr:hypothetical protein DNTS_031569 [Danionella translucida]